MLPVCDIAYAQMSSQRSQKGSRFTTPTNARKRSPRLRTRSRRAQLATGTVQHDACAAAPSAKRNLEPQHVVGTHRESPGHGMSFPKLRAAHGRRAYSHIRLSAARCFGTNLSTSALRSAVPGDSCFRFEPCHYAGLVQIVFEWGWS